MRFDIDAFLSAVDRRQARRFLPDPLPPTGFAELDEARYELAERERMDRLEVHAEMKGNDCAQESRDELRV